jgi:Na+-translocating ferredoxin:NAD+ oxidoreductase RnfG subunit
MNHFDPNPLWPAIGIVAAVVAPVSVTVAATYLTAEQAQKAMFPAADSFAAIDLALTADQRRAIADAAGPQAPHGELRAWAARRGDAILGHVFVDNVVGREDLITYAVGIGVDGKLLPVEILDYRESHGGEIRDKRWLAQFAGRSDPSQLRMRADIKNIAGATLSSEHVTAGVRRILVLWTTALRPATGGN